MAVTFARLGSGAGLWDASRGTTEIGHARSGEQAYDQAKRRWSGRRMNGRTTWQAFQEGPPRAAKTNRKAQQEERWAALVTPKPNRRHSGGRVR